MRKIDLLLLPLLPLFITPAHAAIVHWGDHLAQEAAVAEATVGRFDDKYQFTLTANSTELSAGLVHAGAQNNGISDLIVVLYRDDEDGAVEIGKLSGHDDTRSYFQSFGNLLAGNYHYEISGTSAGTGFYSVQSLATDATDVPEPQTLALVGMAMFSMLALSRPLSPSRSRSS